MVEATPITDDEQVLLDRYLWFYQALASGQRLPATDAQRHFVDVSAGKATAETVHEIAYLKHRIACHKRTLDCEVTREWDHYEYQKCK